MSTLFENIERIQLGKEKLKTSIENKNVVVPDDMLIDNYYSLVDQIQVGSGETPVYQKKTITENGIYRADEGYDALSEVNVNVASGGLNVSNEPQMAYFFKNGRFLEQFDLVMAQNKAEILDCTGMFHNACLFDQTFRTYDFGPLNLSRCTNFYDCFTGGTDNWTIKGNIINFDLSNADNVNYMFNNCAYLTGLTFKEGATIGGSQYSLSSLTLDLSQCTSFTKEALVDLLNSLGANPNPSNTRTIKLTTALYEEIKDDYSVILPANSKYYTLTA